MLMAPGMHPFAVVQPISREAIIERRQPYLRWSAIFGGTAVALGIWSLLQVLGMGLGLAAVDTDDAGSLKGAGIGTGVWSLIAPLIAMFVGALFVGKFAGTHSRSHGLMHGIVMWALAMSIGLWAMFSIVSSVAGGVVEVGGVAARAGSSVISGAASAGGKLDAGDAMQALGVDAEDLVAPINKRLQSEGKPPITAKQLTATVRAVAQRGLHQGRLDREMLVAELARNTNLSRADAEDLATQVSDKYQEVENKVSEAGAKAEHTALSAADKTGKGLLLGGLMMLLSLGAAIGGGAAGVMRRHRRDDRETTLPPRTIVTTGPDTDIRG